MHVIYVDKHSRLKASLSSNSLGRACMRAGLHVTVCRFLTLLACMHNAKLNAMVFTHAGPVLPVRQTASQAGAGGQEERAAAGGG